MKAVTDVERVQQLLAARYLDTAQRLAEQVAERRALLEGHFHLQSGSHSRYFLRFAALGFDYGIVSSLAHELVSRAKLEVHPASTTVVAPESAGILLGRAVSDELGVPLAVMAIDGARRPTGTFRVGKVASGHRVLIVNDVITTGKSIAPLLEMGADRPIGVLTYGALSTDPMLSLEEDRGIVVNWLVAATWRTYDEGECQACVRGEAIVPAGEFN